MAISFGTGTPGYFVKDAAAHASGELIPCELIAFYDNNPSPNGVSLIAFEEGGVAIPYGPIVAPYVWSSNTAQVGMAINPAGYYFVTDPALVNAQNTAELGVTNALASANAAARELTPFQLIEVISGGFDYDTSINGYHNRFGNEEFFYYVSAAQSVTTYRVVIKDVNGAGGQVSVFVSKAARVSPPTVPTYTAIGNSIASLANGTVQELAVPLIGGNGQSIHQIRVVTGPTNGGVTIDLHYQVLQIYPEI